MKIFWRVSVVLLMTVTTLLLGCGQAVMDSKLTSLNNTYDSRLQIENIALPKAVVGMDYSVKLMIKKGNAPYKWEILSGSLPKGLSLDQSSGEITGTVKELNPHPVILKVSDSSGNLNSYVIKSYSFN